jgi:hypothetical protein
VFIFDDDERVVCRYPVGSYAQQVARMFEMVVSNSDASHA